MKIENRFVLAAVVFAAIGFGVCYAAKPPYLPAIPKQAQITPEKLSITSPINPLFFYSVTAKGEVLTSYETEQDCLEDVEDGVECAAGEEIVEYQ